GQLTDLADLMEAPAYDTGGATFAESLVPRTQGKAVFSGGQRAHSLATTDNGLWNNQNWMDGKGYAYPTTRGECMALCEEIKGQGETAPFTYQGVHAQYMELLMHQMIGKQGGNQVLVDIDNLVPDAWRHPAVVETAASLRMLYDNGYIMEGTEALTHTEAQAAWLQGDAAFIPCGTWLENE